MIYNTILVIIIGSINSSCTKSIWCSYRSLVVTSTSEAVFLKMPSCNQKKRSKQRAEYLQKHDENKAKARVLYTANPEKKKASVRDSYKADQKASARDSYKADIESKRSAKWRRYEEDLEENRTTQRRRLKRTLRRTVLLKGGDMMRTSRETALLKGRNTRTMQLPLKHLKAVGIGMTPLSDWLIINVLPGGLGTAGVTELPLPPKGLLWHVVSEVSLETSI